MRTANIAIQTEDTCLAHRVRLAGHHLQESVLGSWHGMTWHGMIFLAVLAMMAFPLAVVRTMPFTLVQLPVIFVVLLVSLFPLV